MNYRRPRNSRILKLLFALAPIGFGAAFFSSSLSAQIFWTNDRGFGAAAVEVGGIWRMELDGENPREIVSGLNRPIGLVVDEVEGRIYWSEDGVPANGHPSRIRSAKLDGSDVKILYDGDLDGFLNAQMIAIEGDSVYWTTFAEGIFSGKKDGSGSPVRLGGGAGAEINLTAIGIDEVAGRIYYGQPNAAVGFYRMDLNGENDQLILNGMVGAAWSFNTLVVDGENGFVYYADAAGNAIRRRNLDGTNEETIAADAQNPYGLTLAGDQIYWGGRAGVIGKVSVEPGSVSEIVASGLPTTEVFGIAVIPGAEGEGFAAWIAEFGLDESVSGAEDDPDGDGIRNVLEYALGGDPTVASREVLPEVETREVAGEEYLTIAYLRRTGGADGEGGTYVSGDVSYAVVASGDLGDWDGAGAVFVSATAEGAPDGFEVATYRSAVPVSAEARQFLRLEVELSGE